MTLITSPKPGTNLSLPLGKWATVAVAQIPTGSSEVHSMLYANVSGAAPAGVEVVQLDVRALRNGIGDGKPGFDETALQTYTAVVRGGVWRCRITATWFGGRSMDTLHWQIMPGHGCSSAVVKGSRYAKGMTN